MKFYKRDPDRALAGMAELTLKQRGAYNSILDLLYSRDGDVPDDDQRIARMIACHWREWAKVKSELMALGKIWSEGGKLRAKRVQETIKEAADFAQKQGQRASQRWQKPENVNEINDPPMPRGNANTPIDTPIAIDRERKNLVAFAPPPADAGLSDVEKAFSNYQIAARDFGLPVARVLTSDRRKKLAARLRELPGGLKDWNEALEKIADSPFCRGENDNGWRADLDFMLQPKSLNRLMEGTYERKANGAG